MKSFLTTILSKTIVSLGLVFLILAPLGQLSIVEAETTAIGSVDPVSQQFTGTAGATTGFTQSGGVTSIPQGTGGIAPAGTGLSGLVNQQVQATPSNPQNPSQPFSTPSISNDVGCNITSGSGFALCLTNIVYVFTIGIGSGFAYVAAYFFDFAVQLSLNSLAYSLTFISQGWTTARDLANMAFLFILIYIAIIIILEAETSSTMAMLATVIAIALVINFSFFFTRLVIDAGNILALQFYNAIQAPSIASVAQTQGAITNQIAPGVINAFSSTGGNAKDLTASIMGMLQFQNLFNTPSFQQFVTGPNSGFLVTAISLSFLYIIAGIMFWLLTVAFAANGVKFLVRIVVLWFLIVAAPLAFIAYAAGKKEYFKKWWGLLVNHTFYPAAFMFIFLMLTNFASQMGQNNSLINGIFQGLTQANSSQGFIAAIGYAAANVGIRLGFVVIVLYMALKVSDQISVYASSSAEKFGSWVGGGLLKAYNVPYKRLGPAAWAGGIDKTLQTGKFSASLFGKGFTLDNKVTRAVGKFGNNLIGYEARRYVTKPLADTAVLGSHGESFTKMKERQGKEGEEVGNNLRDMENRKKSRLLGEVEKSYDEKRLKELTEFEQAQAAYGQPLPPADAAEKQRLEALKLQKQVLDADIKRFGSRELDAMGKKNIESIIKSLTDSQLKTIKDSKKYSEKDKDELENKWHQMNSDAPIQKANKQISLLREINDKLSTSNRISSIATHVVTTGQQITSAKIKNMLEDTRKQLGSMSAQIDTARKSNAPTAAADLTKLHQDRENLLETRKALEELEKEAKKIPPKMDADGKNFSGEFKTK